MNIQRVKRRYSILSARADKLEAAMDALINGGVQSYTIDDRSLTRFDISKLADELEEIYNTLDELESILNGQKARKAVGIIPRD